MSSEISRMKRGALPNDFGESCPVCGERFDAGSSGFVYTDQENTVDCISWVRVCYGDTPGEAWFDFDDIEDSVVAFAYIHKDEHIDV